MAKAYQKGSWHMPEPRSEVHYGIRFLLKRFPKLHKRRSPNLGYAPTLKFPQEDKAYMMVSLTSTVQRKNSGEYNGGGEIQSNPKEDSLTDGFIGHVSSSGYREKILKRAFRHSSTTSRTVNTQLLRTRSRVPQRLRPNQTAPSHFERLDDCNLLFTRQGGGGGGGGAGNYSALFSWRGQKDTLRRPKALPSPMPGALSPLAASHAPATSPGRFRKSLRLSKRPPLAAGDPGSPPSFPVPLSSPGNSSVRNFELPRTAGAVISPARRGAPAPLRCLPRGQPALCPSRSPALDLSSKQRPRARRSHARLGFSQSARRAGSAAAPGSKQRSWRDSGQ
ncbi:uncharacterized protein [Equus asinus]|uniref:uncharacterized protein n=1 Tax=Equus asinus TaxID=9793 RepID=UPI0038F72F71